MACPDLKRPALTVALCLLSAVASAQTAPEAEARAHFDRGVVLANGRAFAEAVAEFNRAYELSHSYTVLYNLGQAYIGMGHPIYALDALSRFLDEGGQQVPAATRAQVEATMGQQRRRIATIEIRVSLPGATIWLDGVEIGKSPLPTPYRVVAGPHEIAAALPGHSPWSQRLTLAGQEQKTVEIGLEPLRPAPVMATTTVAQAPASAATPTAPVSASPLPATATVPTAPVAPDATAAATSTPTPLRAPSKVPAYIVGGVGIGSLIVGAVFGFRAISKENDSDSACPSDRCSQRGVDLHNQAKTSALVSDLTIGAGLVSVAVASYLFIRSSRTTDETPRASSAIRLEPQLAPGFAGLSLGGSL
jgi:hypothetical protein